MSATTSIRNTLAPTVAPAITLTAAICVRSNKYNYGIKFKHTKYTESNHACVAIIDITSRKCINQ